MKYFEIIARKLRKARQLKNEKGWRGIERHLGARFSAFREARNYRKWMRRRRLTDEKRRAIRRRIEGLKHRPRLSVVVPVYDVEEKWLRRCLESVFEQLYENWELCVADDHSPRPHIRKILEEYAARDRRVKVVFRETNGHISAASNSALELATGEFCVLLDHDDELTEDALFWVARELNERPETAMIYSDEDLIDERGRRFSPKFKPDFSRDLFYSLNLVTHLSAYRTDVLRAIGGFRGGLEGSQDYDLALRFTEAIDEKQIRHIPKILYHWRAISGSVALSSDEKPYAHERARRALSEHFARTGKAASVSRGIYQLHRVRYELPANPPRVSLILSTTGDTETAKNPVERFIEATAYENLEIVVIAPDKRRDRSPLGSVKTISRGDSSNADVLNRAASVAGGEILCFVDAHLRPLSKDWLEELASFALQTEIGAVGGKILGRNETVSGGASIVGFGGALGAAFRGLPRAHDGYLYRARVVNNFSAVSAGCLAVRRALFDETGGFDAENLPDSLFDADFCLRLGEKNFRVVFTPYAELIEIEKSGLHSEPTAAEIEFFRRNWQNVIARDPFYNPNLSLAGETFTIEI
ncbi:MAG TPA: glycosyltransferase [Pyrinomonadaceae bacterium]|jgi:glycosyltransferase involved in cell wall biosynthesis